MSQTAKSILSVRNYVDRVVAAITPRKHRIFDELHKAILEAFKNVESRPDSIYPSVTNCDAVLGGLAAQVLTGLVITGANLVGDAQKAVGTTTDQTGTLRFTAVLPGSQTIVVAITDTGALTVAADATLGTIDITVNGGVTTAAQVEAAVDAHAVAKFMVEASVVAGGVIDVAETVQVVCTNVDPGTLPVLQIGATPVDGTVTGCGITAWTDTAITFDFDASTLTPGTVQVMRLWVDDVMILNVPLFADLGALNPDEMSIGVRNETGAPITAGALVYLSGWDEAEEKFLVALADANAVGTLATWVMRSSLAHNTNGVANRTHRITSVDTSLGAEGDPIYASTVAGGWVRVIPATGGSRAQVVGRIAVVGALTGAIEIDLLSNAPCMYWSNLDLQNGILSADVNGRALMAVNYFDATTVLNKFDTDSFTNTVLLQLIQNGAFQADANTRALFADGIWQSAKLAPPTIQYAAIDIPGGNGVGTVGALFSSPVVLVAAPGANKITILDSLELRFTGNVAYDGAGAGDDLFVQWTGGAAASGVIDNGNGGGIRLVRAAPGNDFATVKPLEVDTTPTPDAALVLTCLGNDPYTAAGNIAIKAFVRFHIIDVA